MKSCASPGTLNSYAPRYTVGICPAKLSYGGGLGIVHSKVVAFHGFISAFLPPHRPEIKFPRNSSCAPIVLNAAIEIKYCTFNRECGPAVRNGTPLKSEYRRMCPAIPKKCIGIKMQ